MLNRKRVCPIAVLVAGLLGRAQCTGAQSAPDLILVNGRIITVDHRFSIQQAISVRNGRIVAVGTDAAVLKTRGPMSSVVDLHGKTVMPGLIDSHTHPGAASMTEFEHSIPDMESIKDVLDYIGSRAGELGPGKWVELHQVFITRLKEQRYPTREELDRVAPNNPVLFATGPDASLNSLALTQSGIGPGFKPPDGGPGRVEVDPNTGKPTGILRSLTRYVKVVPAGRMPTEADRLSRLELLLQDYVATGITAIGDRDASPDEIVRYEKLREQDHLPLRVSISHHIDTTGPIEIIEEKIRKVTTHPLRKPDPMLQIIGIKTYLDGGMLTGSAYMREPWGVSKIYAITDPAYRGLLFIPRERLLPIVRTTIESGLQFTAHSVGDGAVHTLLDVYQEIDRSTPIRVTRPCITHSNFMSREAVNLLPKLGVSVDIQPDWLYLDSRTLTAQFGYDRLRWFQPLRSIFKAGGIVGGGSDHMQKVGSFRSINPYNPFLGMWIAITRQAKWLDKPVHGEECLSREQAIRMYTGNNAYIVFREKDIGSLEPGKQADLIVLDKDILTCPVNQIREIKPLQTYLSGKLVYSSPAPKTTVKNSH